MSLSLSSISVLLISKDPKKKAPSALEFGTSSKVDVSGTDLDGSSVGIISRVVVAKPDDTHHTCSRGTHQRRRRRDETSSCRVPPSSQQNNPQQNDGEEQQGHGDFGMKEQQPDSPESMPAFAPESESSCPEGHFPICVAPNLLENPSSPGTFDIIPWLGTTFLKP